MSGERRKLIKSLIKKKSSEVQAIYNKNATINNKNYL